MSSTTRLVTSHFWKNANFTAISNRPLTYICITCNFYTWQFRMFFAINKLVQKMKNSDLFINSLIYKLMISSAILHWLMPEHNILVKQLRCCNLPILSSKSRIFCWRCPKNISTEDQIGDLKRLWVDFDINFISFSSDIYGSDGESLNGYYCNECEAFTVMSVLRGQTG